MNSFIKGVILISLVSAFPVLGETIDNMWCQKADGFGKRMEAQGYKRELSLPFGWGGFDSNVSHNISGSQVKSYDIKTKNQWALYAKANGKWVLYQGVVRKNLSNSKMESFVCEVKSGNKIVRH